MTPRRFTALAAALLITACTAAPPPAAAPTARAMAVAPGGIWQVAAVFPAGRDMLVGQQMRLEATEATDALGRICASPVWSRGEATEADFLGARHPGLARTVPTITADCAGRPFASFALWPDGSLMTRADGFVLRLERAEALARPPAPTPMPAETHAPPPDAAPAEHHPPAHARTHAEPPGTDHLVYLASYGSNAAAEKGWRLLAAKSAAIAKASPEMKPVDIKGKGKFVRLYAKAGSDAEAGAMCGEVEHDLPGCGKGP